jgi:hypothetical protein
MATRILGPTGSKRRKRFLFGPLVLAAALAALFLAGAAQAVHDLTFQLDGDVSASTTTNVGGNTQTLDWDSVFTSTGANKDPLPTGFTAAKFDADFLTNANGSFNTTDSTTYATGSKDTLSITPGWQCNHDANVNSKIDIMNAYSGAYTATNGDSIIYFGLERNSNAGDGNVGFWFLQDSNVACSSPSGNTPFTGNHVDGDLLIVSAFTNGGTVSNVSVYRWNGGANGSLGTTPVALGGDCKTQTPGSTDIACATVNGPTNGTGGTITTPWLTANKQDGVGHSLRTSEFFEGGLNLTKSGLAGKCFNVFIADTRSSQSLTATLFDYARGQLGECTSATKTKPVDATDTTKAPASSIPLDPADAKVLVKDQADITVTGVSSFNGSVSFHICGPTAADSTATCDTGGVDLGSKSITSNGTVFSDTATVTAAGRYCFRADFHESSDPSIGVPDSSDHSSTECFVVNPVQPTLTTQATTGPVDFGQKISDTVTLAGTAHEPGTGGPAGDSGSINPATLGGDAIGNITVVAFGPDSCSTTAFTSGAIAASGDGSYGGAGTAFEFQPSAPGQYVFVAAYAGDSPNTLAIAASACSGAPASEKVTVRQIPTEIKTKQSWIPNDTATVSATTGNLAAGGTVSFALYDNATCSGTALYSQNRSISGGSPTEQVGTTNTGAFTITTGYTDLAGSVAGPYSWKVVYTPAAADTAHTGKQSSCDAEHFSTTYTNDPGPGSPLP